MDQLFCQTMEDSWKISFCNFFLITLIQLNYSNQNLERTTNNNRLSGIKLNNNVNFKINFEKTKKKKCCIIFSFWFWGKRTPGHVFVRFTYIAEHTHPPTHICQQPHTHSVAL